MNGTIISASEARSFNNGLCEVMMISQQITVVIVNVVGKDSLRIIGTLIDFGGTNAKREEERRKVFDGSIPGRVEDGAGFIKGVGFSARTKIERCIGRKWVEVDGSQWIDVGSGSCRLLLLDTSEDGREALQDCS